MTTLVRPSALRAAKLPSSALTFSTTRYFGTGAIRMAQASGNGTGGGVNGDEPLIQFRSEGNARVYFLNRPKKHNSLNHDMVKMLSEKMQTWRDSDLCSLIIGTGNERAFCSGGDVAGLVAGIKENDDSGIRFFKDEFEMNWLMAKLGKPYVTVIDGITMGGGAGIALPAPIRIATSRTIFAMPETNIGYAPDVGVNYYLAQLDGYLGAWLAVTGQHIFGRTAFELGLATHYVSPSALPSLIRDLSHIPSPTLANISSLISSHTSPTSPGFGSKKNPDGASPLTPPIRKFLDSAFKHDSIEGVYNALKAGEENEELSEEVREWAAEQRGILDMKSPTGMAVALEGYRRAKNTKRLDAALKNDMSMATAFTAPSSHRASDDFITGVTHTLIDKVRDARAAWAPENLSAPSLSRSEIASKFYDKSASHASLIPTLEFSPKLSTGHVEGQEGDETWGVFRACGLPNDRLIGRIVKGEEKDSGAYAIKEEQLVERLKRNDKVRPYGHSEDELRRVVRSAVERRCEVDADGYLRWK